MTRRQKDLFPELSDGKKYVSDMPELMAEWHPTKNEGLMPEDLTYGSGKKAWWLCSNGHEWDAAISSRRRNGCPYCSNLYVSKGSSLLDLNPTVCEEWDYDKNNSSPSEYNPKSGKKVWWRCQNGDDHVWKAAIHSRTKDNDGVLSGCPFCTGRKPSKDYNLAVIHPDLVQEWYWDRNDKLPQDFTPNSNQSVWWRCAKGHEWKTQINNRSNGRNCPDCNIQSSRSEMRIVTELMTCFPNVLSRKKVEGYEVDVYLPDYNVAIEYDGSYWHSNKETQDLQKQKAVEDAGIRLIRVREEPLRRISSSDILVSRVEEIDKTVIDALLNMINPQAPETLAYLSSDEWQNDKVFKSYLDNFPSPLPENSLEADNPNLCAEWHPTKNFPLSPKNFTPNSGQKVWWLCSTGHEWEATIDSRNSRSRPSGCPYCSPTRKLASAENNMANTRPDLAKYFHPQKNGSDRPENLVEGTGKLLWWICEQGHEWQQRGYAMLKTKGHVCPTCRKTK